MTCDIHANMCTERDCNDRHVEKKMLYVVEFHFVRMNLFIEVRTALLGGMGGVRELAFCKN